MYFAFIDESGQPGGYDFENQILTERTSKYFTLAGILINGEDIIKIQQEVAMIKVKHGLPPDREFKWNAKYKQYGINKETYISFRQEMLSLIAQYHNSVIASIMNKKECYKKKYINNHHDLYAQALSFLMERIQMELNDRNETSAPVLFIFDSRKNDKNCKLDDEVQKAYIRAKGMGTYYMNFPNFAAGALFADSDYSVGVQLADYCAGPIQRNAEIGKDDWYKIIKPAIRANSNGNTKGFGIKIFP